MCSSMAVADWGPCCLPILILHLRGLPVFGVFSNLLVHIVIRFLQLIYLLFLLILAFSIPFYMLFVRDGAAVFVSYYRHYEYLSN